MSGTVEIKNQMQLSAWQAPLDTFSAQQSFNILGLEIHYMELSLCFQKHSLIKYVILALIQT
jgi:hypothetical protein